MPSDKVFHKVVIDYETFYDDEYSLKKMTPAEYVMDPRFICNGAAVKLDDRPTRWLDPEQLPLLFTALPKNSMMISHNLLFDGLISSWIYGWQPRLYVDTMGLARAVLTRLRRYSLAALCKQLGLPDKDVTLLPKVKGMSLPMIKAAGFYQAYTEYAVSDADNCRAIFDSLIEGFPAAELVIMDMVLRCAVEPQFEIDRTLLHEHKTIVAAEKATLLNSAGLANRSGLMSADQFAHLLSQFGVIPPRKISPTNPAKTTWAFARTDTAFMKLQEHEDPRVQALVAARLGLRSTLEETRTERFIEISRKCPRMPIPLRFSGAHTHRLSGEWGINMQNLPRGGRLRSALMAPAGYVVLAGDAAQIEARLVAWLAGCGRMLKSFREGIDVYAEFASSVFGFQVTSESNPRERFIGKTAVLGLGYGLGAAKFADRIVSNSVAQLGYKVEMNESEARDIVYGYRRTYWEIPKLWDVLGNSAIPALLGDVGGFTIGPLVFTRGRILLPSGLSLWYPGMARNGDTGEAEFFNPVYQGMEKLYGGKILENVTQALARIVIMDASLRILKVTGRRFVMQVHDELVYLVPEADADAVRAIIKDEMRRPPRWAEALPLDAKVGAGKTYGDAK